ncbi:MAG: VanW family protein [Bacillota bacterium]
MFNNRIWAKLLLFLLLCPISAFADDRVMVNHPVSTSGEIYADPAVETVCRDVYDPPGGFMLGTGSVVSLPDVNFRNAVLALDMIDGVTVPPKSVFSFNKTVGPRTASRGFLLGRSLFRSRSGYVYKPDFGGGVCQASTVLHRAVVNAGLRVLELHNHGVKAPYAPDRDDAAVFYGTWDYRFQNTLPVPVTVKTGNETEKLTVELVMKDGVGGGERESVFLQGQTLCFLNGWKTTLEAAPFVRGGRMFVPVDGLRRALGVSPESILEKTVMVEPPPVLNGTVFVPVRWAEDFGFEARWDSVLHAVVVCREKITPETPEAVNLFTASLTKSLHNTQ